MFYFKTIFKPQRNKNFILKTKQLSQKANYIDLFGFNN